MMKKKTTNKTKVLFLNGVEYDIYLFKKAPQYLNFKTGEDNLSIFLGNLKSNINKKFEEKSEQEKIKIVQNFLEKEYEKYDGILRYNLERIKKEWKSIETDFFKNCKIIFDNTDFPEGRYRAIESIWGRYICMYDKNIFSFPAHTDYMLMAVIHELLHFAFLNYWDKNFKGAIEEEKLWALAETFNVIVMNKEPFIKWAKYKSYPYPSHKKIYKNLLVIYDASKSLKEFIEKAILILKD